MFSFIVIGAVNSQPFAEAFRLVNFYFQTVRKAGEERNNKEDKDEKDNKNKNDKDNKENMNNNDKDNKNNKNGNKLIETMEETNQS